MLFVSIPSIEDLRKAKSLSHPLELRLDLFPSIDPEEVQNFLQTFPHPILCTFRSSRDGGGFLGDRATQEEWIERILQWGPNFFDGEWLLERSFVERMQAQYPKTAWIHSCHEVREAPSNSVLDRFWQKQGWGYKIVAHVESAQEALSWLLWKRRHLKVSVFCVGEGMEFSRILGAIDGNDLQFVYWERPLAKGQLSLDMWKFRYRGESLSSRTKVYALLGNPVEQSIGDIYHNEVFQKEGLDAVYVKIRVDDLETFWPKALSWGFAGMSVTSPYKEKICPFLDRIEDGGMGAINTIVEDRGKFLGYNTDGRGALDAIERHTPVRGKRLVILGAGGAARAIALEARNRGAFVTVLGRNREKMGAWPGCEMGSFEDIPSSYHILLHAASSSVDFPEEKLLAGAFAMDLVYAPRYTPFLQRAIVKGMVPIWGEEMFVLQAKGQFLLWKEQMSSS